jgi:hypothetical protein
MYGKQCITAVVAMLGILLSSSGRSQLVTCLESIVPAAEQARPSRPV